MILYNRNRWEHIQPETYMFQDDDGFANYIGSRKLFFAEEGITDMLKQRFGDNMKNRNFVDIGANVGAYTMVLAPYFNKTYAFEPVVHTYNIMCGNIAMNFLSDDTVLINSALSDKEGDMIMHYHDLLGSLTHFSDNENDVMAEFYETIGYQDMQSTMHVKTLDSFNITNIGFIKMDVEGHELRVLKGGKETIEKSNYPLILLESGSVNDTDTESIANFKREQRQELFSYLNEMGYVINETEDMNVFLCEHF